AAQALAGISAPLCVACGIEPFAIAARDPCDLVNFGFGDPAADVHYTFYYNCTGTAPTLLPNSGLLAPYTTINRYDAGNMTVTGRAGPPTCPVPTVQPGRATLVPRTRATGAAWSRFGGWMCARAPRRR